jgi:GTP-binding protein Era
LKSAVVAVVGRPSSGKSTLINRICGGKVSIVSSVPQTTRNKVRGIRTGDKGQLILIDTPGFHLSGEKLNRHLTELVSSAIAEADCVLHVADGARSYGEEERAIIDILAHALKPTVIALNKKDRADAAWGERRERLAQALPAAVLHEISALTGEGLDALCESLFSMAPQGEQLYGGEYYTDQPPDFRIAEIVREKAINLTRQEVPHALYVKLEDLEFREEGRVLWVRGFIFVERESQKGILVGKGGERIKRIVCDAEAELAGIFPYEVHLDIRVKVKKDWRKKETLLRKLIQ